MVKSTTSRASRFTLAIGRRLFRLRSLTAVPFILIVVYYARPTLSSRAGGFAPSGSW